MNETAVRAVLLACVLALGGCGITAPRGAEGYADLSTLGFRDVDRTLTLSIGPTLLHFAARYLDDDPELAAMLRELEGVRVRIYAVDGNAAQVTAHLDRMADRLKTDGWAPVMLVRDGGEHTHMLVRASGTTIHGITVLASDGDEEVVVFNLMGDIRPDRFGDVMAALEVDAPEVRVAGMASAVDGP